MWTYDDEWMSSRDDRLRKQRLALLKVETRHGVLGKKFLSRTGIILSACVAFAGVLFAIYLGFKLMAEKLFTKNDRFKIRTIAIAAPSPATHALVLEYIGITEGMNLFGFNIRDMYRSLRRAAAFKRVSIRRILPDTIKVEVVERIPLARLGPTGVLAVDEEGVIFRPPSLRRVLPFIVGARPDLLPGQRVTGLAMAAVELLDVCNDPALGISVEKVAVNRSDHLEATIHVGGRRREILITWPGMGENSSASRNRLQEKLMNARQALLSPRGTNVSRLDITYPDRAYGTVDG
ncbi:MAG: FtsQ-type POTRA domain-containing protein [Kiritimatiellae bacterium]|nr:FtsQ-type POTRA domain-containing protein [Kiritimatiellia bacterium]